MKRLIIAALSTLALAGALGGANAAEPVKKFHITKPQPSTGVVLDACKGKICVKVRRFADETIRIKLEDVSTKNVEFFRITFKDDATGKLVTQIVKSKDGVDARLKGLSAQPGTHVFSVQACREDGTCSKNRKFVFKVS